MNVKLIKKRDEPLFSRTYLDAEIDFGTATPSRNDVKQSIASASSSTPNLVAVHRIEQKFVNKKARVKAYVYKDENSLKEIEISAILERGTKKEKKAQ